LPRFKKCGSSTVIMDRTECIAAAKYVGYEVKPELTWQGTRYDLPMGCSYRTSHKVLHAVNNVKRDERKDHNPLDICLGDKYMKVKTGSQEYACQINGNLYNGWQEDKPCRMRCEENPNCKYYSLWSNGWCRLTPKTTTCKPFQQKRNMDISVYMKAELANVEDSIAIESELDVQNSIAIESESNVANMSENLPSGNMILLCMAFSVSAFGMGYYISTKQIM